LAQIVAETVEPQADWRWLEDYLQLDVDLGARLATFPDDPPLNEAVNACRGLRLLRQEIWECLASFICSSTKQIVQIQQIVQRLSERFGAAVRVPEGVEPAFAFPSAARIAAASEAELRGCLLGFRAPYLKGSAEAVASGKPALNELQTMTLEQARAALMELPGVGRKIADCVLLFAYGFPTAFPIDVWVLRALRELYFPKRGVTMKRLRHFSETHFGPHGGYAQQYLFHYIRTHRHLASSLKSGESRTRRTKPCPGSL
jgi:N-glycosylase/DNA lyase